MLAGAHEHNEISFIVKQWSNMITWTTWCAGITNEPMIVSTFRCSRQGQLAETTWMQLKVHITGPDKMEWNETFDPPSDQTLLHATVWLSLLHLVKTKSYLSCPAVSHSCSTTVRPSTSMFFTWKSTPAVSTPPLFYAYRTRTTLTLTLTLTLTPAFSTPPLFYDKTRHKAPFLSHLSRDVERSLRVFTLYLTCSLFVSQ